MPIGYFGNIIFETSDNRIMNFTDFSRSSSARLEEHKLISRKPLTEFCGPELEKITFTINLNAANGINPEQELTQWRDACLKGIAEPLVIGGTVLGYDKFIVESVSESYNKVYRNGFLYSAKADISLNEYITDPKMQPPTSSKQYGTLNDKYEPYYENVYAQTARLTGLRELYKNYVLPASDAISALLSLIK